MKKTKKVCSNFKPLSDVMSHSYMAVSPSCKTCAYFSSHNCHKDIADLIETELDIF